MELRKNAGIAKLHDFSKVSDLRKAFGLQEIRRGYRECLMCVREFFSHDLVNMKCCGKCRDEGNETVRRVTSWSK